MQFAKVNQIIKLLRQGQNFIGSEIIIKDNCTCCDQYTLIDYVFLNGKKVLSAECLDCVSTQHEW